MSWRDAPIRYGAAVGMIAGGVVWLSVHLALSTMTVPRLILLTVCAVAGILLYPEKS